MALSSDEVRGILRAMKAQRDLDRRRQDENTVRALRLLWNRDPVDAYDTGFNLGIEAAIKVVKNDPHMIEQLNDLAQAAGERRHP